MTDRDYEINNSNKEEMDPEFKMPEGLLQKITGTVGTLVMLLGLGLGVYMFMVVFNTVKDTGSLGATVDQWEEVLVGQKIPAQLSIDDNATSATVAINTNYWNQTIGETDIPLRLATRAFVMAFLIVVAMVLVRIIVAILMAGGKLTQVGTPYKKLFEEQQQMLVEARVRRSGKRTR